MKNFLLKTLGLMGLFSLAWGVVEGTYLSDGESFAVFDGVNDHLQISPATLGSAFEFDGDFTIEAWVYRADWSVVPTNHQSIISYTHNGGYALQLRNTGNLAFKMYSTSNGGYIYTESSYTGLSAGWHHIVIKRDDPTNYLYIDGSEVAQDTGPGGDNLSYDGDVYFELGAEADDNSTPEVGNYFEGALDEVRIWSRSLFAATIFDWRYKIITSEDTHPNNVYLHGYYKLDAGWTFGFMDDASDNFNSTYAADDDLSGSNYSMDTAPRLIDGHYRVAHLDHLVWMDGSASDGSFLQVNDIDASASSTLNSGAGFDPIDAFSGIYDGNDKTISGLTIARSSTISIGLFKVLAGASVSDLTLSSVDISGLTYTGVLAGQVTGSSTLSNIHVTSGTLSGKDYTGGLVGKCEDSSQISNSHVSINVAGNQYVGGFAGLISNTSQVTQCYAEGDVSDTSSYTGGFVGLINGGTLSQCYASGDVTGTNSVGGFAGTVSVSEAVSIQNCYSTGSATGSSHSVGGWTGQNYSATVSNCYSTGVASGSSDVGGFVGYDNSGTYSNSFWDVTASGQSSACGSGSISSTTGKTTAEMKNYTTFTDAGWDFVYETANGTNNYWDADQVGDVNSGYVILAWQSGADNSLPAVVSTTAVTEILTTTATSGGNVTSEGSASVTARGVCWSTSSSPTTANTKTTDGSGTGSYSSSITGLSPSTTYYVRAYATNSVGTSYGSEESFTTASEPTVSTTAVTEILTTTATSGGNVTNEGSASVTARGVCWSTSSSPTTADPKTTDESGTGSYSSSITGLSVNTYYYVRAYATNSVGTSYGDNVGFATAPTATEPSLVDSKYQIATLENLYWIAQDDTRWGHAYIQTADINASSTSSWFPDGSGTNQGWLPIGNRWTKFTGSYDGQGYVIHSLFIDRSSTDYIGLFGHTNGSTIQNTGLTNVDISGSTCVGGLVGYNYSSSTVSNSYSTGSVSGNNYVGGLVGASTNTSTVSNSYSTGSVSGNNYVGGLVGYHRSSTVSNSYSTGSVSESSEDSGGLVGYNEFSTVSNSYSTGSVSGGTRVGGLVGYNYSSSTVSNSYSTGSVSGTNSVGGLVGFNNGSTVSNGFWDSQTSGTSTGIGSGTTTGATGKTTAQMKDYTTFTAAGWDFVSETANGTNNYWDADQAGTVNNGYVILAWQSGADNSLPVELSFFKAEIESPSTGSGTGIQLTWKTESETENMGFILESRRKGDASWLLLIDFNGSKALEGYGSTSEPHSYEYIDTKAAAGYTHEYRLSDVDYSGKVTRHSNIEIYLPEPKTHLLPGQFALRAMYPNPFNPSLNISYETGEATQVSVVIFDLQGRELMTLSDNQHQSGSHELVWQADHLPSGVYLVQIRSNLGLTLQKVTLLK